MRDTFLNSVFERKTRDQTQPNRSFEASRKNRGIMTRHIRKEDVLAIEDVLGRLAIQRARFCEIQKERQCLEHQAPGQELRDHLPAYGA